MATLKTRAAEALLILTTSMIVLACNPLGDKSTADRKFNPGLRAGATFNATWPFSDSTGVTYNSNQIEVIGGVARLKILDQTDDDNTSTGFGGGTLSGVQWDIPNSWIELDNTTTQLELPDGGVSTSWVDMTGTVLLLHANGVGSVANGATVIDASTYGHDMTVVADAGGIGYSAARIGQGLDFDGTNDYLTVADDASLSMSTNMTVMAWVKQTDYANAKRIITKWDTNQATFALQTSASLLGSQISVLIANALNDGGANGALTPSTSWRVGSWHHVAFVYNGAGATNASRLKIYLDGVPQTLTFSGAIPAAMTDATSPLRVGQLDSIAGYMWNGSMDEIAVLNRSMTAGEIAHIYEWQRATYTGIATSRIMDGSAAVAWNALSWTPTRPIFKNLPNSAQDETTYANDNVSMANNIALLHMNEASWSGVANEVVDSSGQANHGVSVGSASTVPIGKYASAGRFDGFDDAVKVPDNNSLDLTTNFSIEFWMRPEETYSSSSNSNMGLFDKGAIQAFLSRSEGKLNFSLQSNAATAWASTTLNTTQGSYALASYKGLFYAAHRNTLTDISVCNPAGGGNLDTCDNAADWSVSLSSAYTATFSMNVFNGRLYAGMGLGAGHGDVLVCDPTAGGLATACDNAADWTTAFDGAKEGIMTMVPFMGRLYVGQGYLAAGSGDVYVCSPDTAGATGVCDNAADWTLSYDGTTASITAMAVYKNRLYIGDAAGDVKVCDPKATGTYDYCEAADWSAAFTTGATFVTSLIEFNDRLYAAFHTPTSVAGDVYVCNPAGGGAVDVCDNAADWSLAFDGVQDAIYSFAVYDGKLYAGQGESAGDGDIYVCDPAVAGNTEVCDNAADWSLSFNGARDFITALGVYNGRLYAGEYSNLGTLVRVLGNNEVATTTTSSWTGAQWKHVALTYDGANMKIYVDGALETTRPTAITVATNAYDLLVGKMHGPQDMDTLPEAFDGLIDEFAVYGRVLSAAEIATRYRRGLARAKFQVRSCDDAACSGESFIGPDGTASTFYSELNNSTLLPPALTLVGVPNNQYFQYRAYFETESSSLTPEIQGVVVGPSRYASGSPTITSSIAIPYSSLNAWTEVLGATNAGSVTYQISRDGSVFYYHNGAAWVPAAGVAQSNSAAQLSSNLSTFGAGSFSFRAFLTSNGSQACEIDSLTLEGTY